MAAVDQADLGRLSLQVKAAVQARSQEAVQVEQLALVPATAQMEETRARQEATEVLRV